MRGELERWLRSTWPRLGQGPLESGTPLHLALLAGAGEGWRWVALVWRGAERRPRLVVKIPRDPCDFGRATAEPEVLDALARVAPPGPVAVPRLVARGEVAGRPVTAETAVPGRPLLVHLAETRRPAALLPGLTGLVSWLSALAAATSRPLTPAEAEEWITAPLRAGRAAVVLDPDERHGLTALGTRADDLLRTAPVPAVLTHNDAGPPNVLVDRAGRAVSLVDWESGGHGLPLTDVLYLLVRVAEEAGEDAGGRDTAFARRAWSLLEDGRRGAGVAPGWVPVLTALAWLQHAANEERRRPPGTPEGLSRQRLRAHLHAVAAGAAS